MKTDNNNLTLKSLTKSNVWELQENDVFRLLKGASKDVDVRENLSRYVTIIKTAFEIENILIDKDIVIKKYIDRGFKVVELKLDDSATGKVAIKKRPISRINDLTYENIRHISAAKLIEVLDRNFGSGWDGLSQSVKDIIESGFDISTTTLPSDRLKKPGSMYEKKVADGFEVLEIQKGTWTEAIFAKVKPLAEKVRMKYDNAKNEEEEFDNLPDDDLAPDLDDDDDNEEEYGGEETYITEFDTDENSLDIQAEELSDEY